MPSFLDTHNLSILAIPAYKWDNRNPRSSTLKSKLKDRLSAEEFAKYERLEACHANGMENMPLFAAAVVLGNMAGLKKQGLDGLNGFAGLFLAVRLLYTGVYATHQTQGPTAARSVLWFTGVALCFRTIIRAARALGGDRI